MNYEKLLDKAKKELPETAKESARFVIPKVRGHVEGSKTILSNFLEIASTIQRNPKHLLKYLLRAIASSGEIVQNRVIIGSKTSAGRINEVVQEYLDQFVYCRECGSPDTKMTKESSVNIVKCHACGARYSVYSKV